LFCKRLLDVVLASVVLVLAAPLLLVLALLVKVTSPGPAFFRQVRVGRSGRTFRILKLRTMQFDAEARLRSEPALRATYLENGFKVPPELDSRLTTLGRFMRRASLDELPQLINVVRGDMSLVGPRPVVPLELDLLGEVRGLYERMRPGITGYWQVNGRSEVGTTDRIELDRHYLVHWSLWLDLKILVRTLPAVFSCRGAH
jgi:lipopolysaccharide/colanic/teichoic acid biosynthesis glycosyltransferase